MKKYFLALILTSITFNSFSQEKSKIRPFVNPPETKPRFMEDAELTQYQNNLSFSTKIRDHFIKYIENSATKDSIKHEIWVSIEIDTIGVSKFLTIKPQKLETIYLKKELTIIINSLPKFIPATQRNKKVKIIYIIPLLKKE